MIGQTVRVARALLEVLGSLTGRQATGYALVHATGADVLLPAGCFAAPVREYTSGTPATTNKQIDRENLVRTREDTVITAAGALVPIISMLGGARQNLATGLALRWEPAVTGVELSSTIATGGLTGGVTATGPGAVNQVVLYEEIRPAQFGLDLFKARAESGAPAVVLSWNASPGGTPVGRNVTAQPEQWVAFVVVGTQSGGDDRGRSGLDTIDGVAGLVSSRSSIDEFVFSAPPSEVTGRRRIATSESGYVYAVEFRTFLSTDRITNTAAMLAGLVPEDAEPVEWETTRYDLKTGATDETFPVVAGAVYPMLLDGTDDGFDDGFG